MDLGDYLKAAAGTSWSWGTHDCSAWPARWAGLALPAYCDEAGAQSLIASAGGLVGLWRQIIGDRLPSVDTPNPGDIGIITAIGGDGTETEVGAIWNGRRWSFLTLKGLAGASASALAIWRVECPMP